MPNYKFNKEQQFVVELCILTFPTQHAFFFNNLLFDLLLFMEKWRQLCIWQQKLYACIFRVKLPPRETTRLNGRVKQSLSRDLGIDLPRRDYRCGVEMDYLELATG